MNEAARRPSPLPVIGCRARLAARVVAASTTADRNSALLAMAAAIEQAERDILDANARDLAASSAAAPLLDRLRLTDKRIAAMAEALREIAALPDPVGEITGLCYRPSGIQVGRMRVPLGVVGMIYEARPNVTVEAAALCLKSGNAVILRGGSDALASNRVLVRCLRQGLAETGVAEDAIQFIDSPDRALAVQLTQLDDSVDVIIPRGGRGLVETVCRNASVPVIRHLDGNCHVYVDAAADPVKAIDILANAKAQRPGTCNAAESLLIHMAAAETILPEAGAALGRLGVELRGCPRTRRYLPDAVPAEEADFTTEYLDLVASVKVVDDVDEAIAHINRYGSGHSDAIVTENMDTAWRFLREVDSGSVLVNASTRLADGGEYGLGAEIGISSNKLHVRGPVGLDGLTSQKWIVLGKGHVRH